MVLQLIRSELVHQPDASPFLLLVDQQSPALRGNRFERQFELRPAIAAKAMENISRQTLGMDPHQRRISRDLPHLQNDRFLQDPVGSSLKPEDAEVPEAAGKIGLGDLTQFK